MSIDRVIGIFKRYYRWNVKFILNLCSHLWQLLLNVRNVKHWNFYGITFLLLDRYYFRKQLGLKQLGHWIRWSRRLRFISWIYVGIISDYLREEAKYSLNHFSKFSSFYEFGSLSGRTFNVSINMIEVLLYLKLISNFNN